MSTHTTKAEREFTHTFNDGSTAHYHIKIVYKKAPVKKINNNNNNNNNIDNYFFDRLHLAKQREMLTLQKQKHRQLYLKSLEAKRLKQKRLKNLESARLQKYLMQRPNM